MFLTETCFLNNVICTLSAKLIYIYAVHIPEYVPGLSFGSAPFNQKENNVLHNDNRFQDINETGLP
jgi:hypothetical protein